VVDQSGQSSPDLAKMERQHSGTIRWHRVGFRGLPTARNYGWQHAAHEAVVFVDDDIRCGPDLVAEHVRALCLPGVGVVAGGVEEAHAPKQGCEPDTGVFRNWTATPLRGFEAEWQGDVDHAPGGNFSTWRHLIARLGGIDEGLQVGAALYEETDYCLRVKKAGYRVYFNGRARLTHLAAPDGGCRVPDIRKYVLGLAHNRAVLIQRHLRWYQRPTALLELLRLGGAYAAYYRRPAALASCVRGCLAGLRAGSRAPVCHGKGVTGVTQVAPLSHAE
jgi:GT2 family glycosyltransferase